MNAANPLESTSTPVAQLPVPIAPSGFPVSYEEAKLAITRCESPIECRSMADKAAAMAIFARLRDDTELHNRAVRLQAWAERQWGKLDRELYPDRREQNLKQNQGPSRNVARDNSVGKRPPAPDGTSERRRIISRRLASVPEDQFTEHVEGPEPNIRQLAELGTIKRLPTERVSNIPDRDFEAALAGSHPPTITEMVPPGTVTRPQTYVPDNIEPAPMGQATKAQTLLREFAAFCGTTDPAAVARACAVLDTDVLRAYVETACSWLHWFVVSLPAADESGAF